MKIWFQAIRPKTLPAVIVPVLVAACMAKSDGYFYPTRIFFTLLFGLLIQIITNLANDLFDYIKGADTEDRVGPKRLISSGEISIEMMKKVLIALTLLSLFISIYLTYQSGILIFYLALISILLAYLYTSGPYPLAYVGLGDVFVLIFFGPVATAASYYIFTSKLDLIAIFIGLSLGFISTAILVVNNLRDYETDKVANKNTLVVKFGQRFGRIEYVVLLLAAFAIPLFISFFFKNYSKIWISSITLFFALPNIVVVLREKDPRKLNPILGRTGLTLVLFGLFFSALVLFS